MGQIRRLQAELDHLRETVAHLTPKGFAPPEPDHMEAAAQAPAARTAPVEPVAEPEIVRAPPPAPAPPPEPVIAAPPPSETPLPSPEPIAQMHAPEPEPRPVPVEESAAAAPPPPRTEKRPAFSWEQQIGARLPVWVGAIALALSGIFLVKYSIDTGLLNPFVRCVLAGVFGVAMLAASEWIARRPAIANGERIAQALAGAGVADLYGTIFATATVYEFISPAAAFLGMAANTAVAVLLSLRRGPPIAILGLAGGFLAPALVGASDPNAPVLFGYLYALSLGLFFVIRMKGWWFLAWPTIIAAFVWVLIWLAGGGTPGDGLWLGLFLLAMTATGFYFLHPREGDDPEFAAPFVELGLIALAGTSILLLGAVVARSEFGLTEWALNFTLAAGATALAIFDERRYRFLPWLAMAASAYLLLMWRTPETENFTLILLAFATLFTASGLARLWRAQDPLLWSGLAATSALLFYLIAFAKLNDVTKALAILAPDGFFAVTPFWGALALLLSAGAALVTARVVERFGTTDGKSQRLLTLFALTATAFLSLGLSIEIDPVFLPVAIVAQSCAVAWINTRVDIQALRPIAGGLTIFFALLLLPHLANVFEYVVLGTLGAPIDKLLANHVVTRPIFHLGVPAAFIAASSYYLRLQRDGVLVHTLERAAILLLGTTGYFLIRQAFVAPQDVLAMPGPAYEGAIITQALFAYGLALLLAGQRISRQALIDGGVIAGALAVFRVVQFDIQPVQLASVWLPLSFGAAADPDATVPIALSPILTLAPPAAFLIAYRVLLNGTRPRLLEVVEYLAVTFAALMGYFLIRQAFNPDGNALAAVGTLIERNVISQALLVYAITLVVGGRFFAHRGLVRSGLIAATVAVLRIVWFDIQPLTLLVVSMRLTSGVDIDATQMVPIAEAPLLTLALPSLLLAALSYILRREGTGALARLLEYAVAAFVGLMVYFLLRHAFNAPDLVFASPGTFLERGTITAVLALYAAALMAGGRRWGRETFVRAGIFAAVIAGVRAVFFEFLKSSPLVAPHDVGAAPIFNALLVNYGLAAVGLYVAARELERRNLLQYARIVFGASLIAAFALVSLEVRQFFQGPVLNGPDAGNSEVYAYSAAWLLMGIALLVAGTMRKDRILRIASLAVMVLTVAKVFLYDASELTGLFRVFSFMGLGLSLLGLSWFYTKFVFGSGERKNENASP